VILSIRPPPNYLLPSSGSCSFLVNSFWLQTNSTGVRLSHQAVLNRLQWQWCTFPYGPEEHICVFKTALTFVDSVAELWGPLLQGRNVFVVPRDMTKNPEQLLHILEEQKVGLQLC
jgi:non-ribosomal peptide synthetase component F